MAYTTPLTAVSNTAFTAAQYNASDRDNMLVTPAALVTAASQYTVGTAANAIAARQVQQSVVTTQQTTTSTSFADLTTVGPTVTVTTGANALAWFGCQMQNSLANTALQVAYSLNGAVPDSSIDLFIDGLSTAGQAFRASVIHYHSGSTALTPGSNTFKLQYKVGGGTGTFYDRTLGVMPF